MNRGGLETRYCFGDADDGKDGGEHGFAVEFRNRVRYQECGGTDAEAAQNLDRPFLFLQIL